MVVISNYKDSDVPNELRAFLRNEFGLSDDAIDLARKHSNLELAPLPIILWTFGLITLSEYQIILNWIEDNL